MKKSHKTGVSILLIILVLGGLGIAYYLKKARYIKESAPTAISLDELNNNDEAKDNTATATSEEEIADEEIPAELNLEMAFYSQAPFGDWGEPWQNACEEASMLLIANAYNKHNWTKEEFRSQILDLVKWENDTFGDYKDTNAKQMLRMLRENLNLEGKIHENPSFEDVKKILAQGHLIIAPLAGKELKNPFYTDGGPEYHALVIKGYKEGEKIITADVGTRQGEDYVYTWQTIAHALHDYTEPIDNGTNLIIEVMPPSQS